MENIKMIISNTVESVLEEWQPHLLVRYYQMLKTGPQRDLQHWPTEGEDLTCDKLTADCQTWHVTFNNTKTTIT